MGLSHYGNAANFSARQAARWHKQYLLATAPASGNARQDSMLQLAAWLREHAPEQDARLAAPTIVHGDYRLDNLVLSEDGRSVRAVLDWELSTLGDPLSDVAYVCMVRALLRRVLCGCTCTLVCAFASVMPVGLEAGRRTCNLSMPVRVACTRIRLPAVTEQTGLTIHGPSFIQR